MRGSRSVVLVDDDVDAQMLVQFALDVDADFDLIACADDLASATALLRTVKPDIVITDRMLPDCDLLTRFDELRSTAPEATIVVLSAQPRAMCEPLALAAGADAYMDKVTFDGFAEALHQALRGGVAGAPAA